MLSLDELVSEVSAQRRRPRSTGEQRLALMVLRALAEGRTLTIPDPIELDHEAGAGPAEAPDDVQALAANAQLGRTALPAEAVPQDVWRAPVNDPFRARESPRPDQ